MSCTKETRKANIKKVKSGKQINILTLDRINETGFLKRFIPLFEQTHNCRIVITSCTGTSELIELIKNPKDIQRYDLILGIDNNFLLDNIEFDSFSTSDVFKKHAINSTYKIDSENRVIPYGYGYLAILYNEQKITEPPESFGQLQDARFLKQLVICDPRNSGIGRASLFWTIAMFGNDGFQQFWKSVKKNIYLSKDTWQEALQVLNAGECGMAFGLTSTPAWILETKNNPLPIKASLLREGSFLYVEAAAITAKTKNKQLAEAFLDLLLSAEMQKFVAYDLGLFPTNDSAPLPTQFSFAPFTAYSVNDKLTAENPQDNLSNWLDFWERLFSRSIL